MATTILGTDSMSNTHQRMFVIGSLCSLVLLGSIGLVFANIYGPQLPPFAFWSSLAWLTILVLIVWAVYCVRLSSKAESPMSVNTRLNFKPGAFLIAALYALFSAALLIVTVEAVKRGQQAFIYVIPQMIVLFVFVALLTLRFTKIIPGLPPQASDQARANILTLQSRLDELEELRTSEWLKEAQGVAPLSRLKASISWWREELATSMPQSGLIMSQPFVAYFLENVGRDLQFLRDLRHQHHVRDDELLEAEQRVLEGINRTGQIVRKLRLP